MGDEDDSNLTETQKAMRAAAQRQKEEDEKWFAEYEVEIAEKREQEAAELEELRARIEERRAERAEDDEKRLEFARLAAERHKQEEEEKKASQEAAKRKKQEARAKKQALMAGGMAGGGAPPPGGGKKGRAFKVTKKVNDEGVEEEVEEAIGQAGREAEANAAHKASYLAKFKEPIAGLDEMDITSLRSRIKGLYEQIVQLESGKYDYEERAKIQQMDFNELKEREKQQLRKKAEKMGLDADTFTKSKHPPKVKTQNAYDRVIDSRGFVDRKNYYLKAPPPPKSVAHGTARPPQDWGRSYNSEEIQVVRKHLEENPPKYQELEPIEGAKPPVEPKPLQMPPPDPEPTADAPKPAAAAPEPEPAAAEPAAEE